MAYKYTKYLCDSRLLAERYLLNTLSKKQLILTTKLDHYFGYWFMYHSFVKLDIIQKSFWWRSRTKLIQSNYFFDLVRCGLRWKPHSVVGFVAVLWRITLVMLELFCQRTWWQEKQVSSSNWQQGGSKEEEVRCRT